MANGNPFALQQNQQQQSQGMDPMQGLQMYQQFAGGGESAGAGGFDKLAGLFGGGAESGAGSLAAAESTGVAGGTAGGAAGGEAAGSALMSNPIGWIAAAALAQNVADNKGVSSWQAGLKGQGGANIGDYYMKDKWGMEDDDPLYDAAGVMGWGSGGGVFNPSYLNKKIFGDTD